MKKLRELFAGVMVTGALAVGSSAYAGDFGSYRAVLDSSSGLVRCLTVSVVGQTGPDTVNYSNYVGPFLMNEDSNPGETWYSFCTDLSATLRRTYDYCEVPVTGLAPDLTLGKPDWDRGGIQSAAAIYKAHVGGLDGMTGDSRKAYGAALQLAIWEALYDTEGTYGLDGGNFTASVCSSEVTGYFDTFMGAAAGSYAGVNWLQPKVYGGSQGGFRLVSVPEPASVLSSLVVLGLLVAGRRKVV